MKLVSGSYYFLRDVSAFKELRTENKILRENVNSLRKELLKLQEAGLENKRLRELLGFKESQKRRFVPAMVIAREPLGLRDVIIIDKGKSHNVQKDMAVISGNGLVGRVRESGRSISRILLITDSDSAVSAIVHRTRDEGAAIGTRRRDLIMKYLPLDSDVKTGDKVITSGFDSIFEKGILIGEITSVEKDANNLYLNAIVKPEVDMARLEEVLVMH